MKKYVLHDLNNSGKLKIEQRSSSAGVICEAPKDENGNYIEDIDIVSIIDEVSEFGEIKKVAIVDQIKKADKDQLLAQKQNQNKLDAMRAERDKRLAATDYMMMPDYPMADKSAIELYRQELRDLPENIIDINNINWPIKP